MECFNGIEDLDLDAQEKSSLFLSCLQSLLEVSRLDRLCSIYALRRMHFGKKTFYKLCRRNRYEIARTLHNLGIRNQQAYSYLFNRNCQDILRTQITPTTLLLQQDSAMLSKEWIEQNMLQILPFCLVLSAEVQVFSRITQLFHGHLQESVLDLTKRYLSQILSELICYYCSRFDEVGKVVKLVQELAILVHDNLEDSQGSIESSFLAFIYQANLDVEEDGPHFENTLINLKASQVYSSLLGKHGRAFSKKVPYFLRRSTCSTFFLLSSWDIFHMHMSSHCL